MEKLEFNELLDTKIRYIWKNCQSAENLAIINLQHIWLIQWIARLDEECKSTASQEELERVFKTCTTSLLEYAKYHFLAEEMIMEHMKFPGVIQHAKSHKRFFDEIDFKIKDSIQIDKVSVLKLILFLKDWLAFHIKKDDMDYVEFIKKYQINPNGVIEELVKNGKIVIEQPMKELYFRITGETFIQ